MMSGLHVRAAQAEMKSFFRNEVWWRINVSVLIMLHALVLVCVCVVCEGVPVLRRV